MRGAWMLGLAATLVAAPSLAATKTTLAAIVESPKLPVHRDDAKEVETVPGITVDKAPPWPKATFVNVHADTKKGFCFVTQEDSLRLSEATSTAESASQELWHLATKDQKTVLERTSFAVDKWSHRLSVQRKVRVELTEVARRESVVVWAFRSGGDVIVIAEGANGGVEGKRDEDSGALPFLSSDCGFGAMRIDASKPAAGSMGQLNGSIPDAAKPENTDLRRAFTVDASLSRTGKAEPRLAVRIRLGKEP